MAEVLCPSSRRVMPRLGHSEPKVLRPFDRREGCRIEVAAHIAGRDVRTLRRWCVDRNIGRRIAGGHWMVSKVALSMLLNGDDDALAAYLSGDRNSTTVRNYFEEVGLGNLPRGWVAAASKEG